MADKFDDKQIPEQLSLGPITYDDLSRREVRALIVHLLYSLYAHDNEVSVESVIDNYNRGFNLSIPLDGEVARVTQGIMDQAQEIDELYKPLLTNWRFDRLGVCTQLILRMALWELRNTDTDPRIVINEAVELAKCFSEEDAYKFINGILDRYVKTQEKAHEPGSG